MCFSLLPTCCIGFLSVVNEKQRTGWKGKGSERKRRFLQKNSHSFFSFSFFWQVHIEMLVSRVYIQFTCSRYPKTCACQSMTRFLEVIGSQLLWARTVPRVERSAHLESFTRADDRERTLTPPLPPARPCQFVEPGELFLFESQYIRKKLLALLAVLLYAAAV